MKLKFVLGLLPVLSVFNSCAFSEEITLNENGSGSISINFDGSAFMNMAGDMADASNEPQEQATDTVIYFADILREGKDSIALLPALEQEKLHKLEPYRMRMRTDPEAKEMIFGLTRDFDKIEDIEDALNAFQSTGVLDKKEDKSTTPGFGETTAVSYGYQSGKFHRKAFITDSVLHQQRIDSLGESTAFFDGSAYILKINFPRRILKAPQDSITEISQDRKTLIRQVSFMEYVRNPSVLDLEVLLEK